MALSHDLRQGLAFEMALPRSTGENSSGCSRLTDATTDESETNRLRCGRNKHILETKNGCKRQMQLVGELYKKHV